LTSECNQFNNVRVRGPPEQSESCPRRVHVHLNALILSWALVYEQMIFIRQRNRGSSDKQFTQAVMTQHFIRVDRVYYNK